MNDKTQTTKDDTGINLDDALFIGAMINERCTINYGMPDSTVELHRNYEQRIRNKGRARRHQMKVARIKCGDMGAVRLIFQETKD